MRTPKIKSPKDWSDLDVDTRSALSRRAINRARKVRLSHSSSHAEYAEALGFTNVASYSHLETRLGARLTYKTLLNLSKLTKLSVQELLGSKEPAISRPSHYPLEIRDRKKVSELLIEQALKVAEKTGMTHAETAKFLGLKRGTASYRYWLYGRRALRDDEFISVTEALGLKASTVVKKALAS